jgi:hypothetical protein
LLPFEKLFDAQSSGGRRIWPLSRGKVLVCQSHRGVDADQELFFGEFRQQAVAECAKFWSRESVSDVSQRERLMRRPQVLAISEC